ncbi:MAG: hypothetical protein M3Q32_01250 [Pseudomonadota bacterium]|nr:hypothetical protein [Pseudomonadota bacterium]
MHSFSVARARKRILMRGVGLNLREQPKLDASRSLFKEASDPRSMQESVLEFCVADLLPAFSATATLVESVQHYQRMTGVLAETVSQRHFQFE